MIELPSPLLGAGTKAYLGVVETRQWLIDIAARAEVFAAANLFVAPSFLSLHEAKHILAGTGISWAAQNVHWAEGPYTGEVSAEMLVELGCVYVEVGHSERRRHFGETDETTARKAQAVTEAGMTPIVCVGEQRRGDPTTAAGVVRGQLAVVLDSLPHKTSVLVAYAPVWAVGADAHADPDHVATVLHALDDLREQWAAPIRLLYGGAAKPGTYPALRAAGAPVDGPFVGRACFDVATLADIAAEVTSAAAREESLA